MGDVLTKKQVDKLAAGMCCDRYVRHCPVWSMLRQSHEALRAELKIERTLVAAKDQQLDQYDEQAAQAEMVAIAEHACEVAMQRMEDTVAICEALTAENERLREVSEVP